MAISEGTDQKQWIVFADGRSSVSDYGTIIIGSSSAVEIVGEGQDHESAIKSIERVFASHAYFYVVRQRTDDLFPAPQWEKRVLSRDQIEQELKRIAGEIRRSSLTVIAFRVDGNIPY